MTSVLTETVIRIVRNIMEDLEVLWSGIPRWLKILLHIVFLVSLAILASYLSPLVPNLASYVLEEFRVSGVVFLALLVSMLLLQLLMYQRLVEISSSLREVYRRTVEVKSPGVVYVECAWLTLSRVHVDRGNRTCHIHVRCTHQDKPMTREGCPLNCPKFRVPQPSGVKAFSGMVLGGLLGLVAAGPVGVLLGGLIGYTLGYSAELSSLDRVRNEIRRCEAQGLRYEVHAEDP